MAVQAEKGCWAFDLTIFMIDWVACNHQDACIWSCTHTHVQFFLHFFGKYARLRKSEETLRQHVCSLVMDMMLQAAAVERQCG